MDGGPRPPQRSCARALRALTCALTLLAGCADDAAPAAPAAPLPDTAWDLAAPEDAEADRDLDLPVGPCAELPALSPDGARYAGETQADDHRSRCGGRGGHDRALRFEAPAAGRWRFHATSADFDPVLSARSDCLLAESEHTCNDDLRFPRRRDAAVQLDLAAGETLYLIVDAYVDRGLPRGGRFELRAEPVPVRRAGAACDPLGLTDGCPAGQLCAPEDPQRIAGPGACVVDAPPHLERVELSRHETQLALRLTARDDSRDVSELRLALYADGARLPLDGRGADTWILALKPTAEPRFTVTWRGPVLAGNPHADTVALWLVDRQGNASPQARLSPPRSLPRALGAGCDPDGVGDHCPEGAACRGTPPRCLSRSPPVIDTARAFWSRDPPALGLEIHGRDPDDDVAGAWLAVLDGGGARLGEATRPFDTLAQGPGGRFEAWLGFAVPADLPVDRLQIQAIDAEGLRSSGVEVPAEGPRPGLAGEDCDPVGARIHCPGDLRCVGTPPRCARPDPACPPGTRLGQLEPVGEGRFAARLVLTRGEAPLGPASCGGGLAQAAVAFTAPEGGRWIFEAQPDDPEGDALLSARSACGEGAAWSERACNDDRALGDYAPRLSLSLAPGETLYLILDGYVGSDGYWVGPATVTARPAD